MGKVISLSNQKGGVGKTYTVFTMAAELVARKLKVLCVDMDPQASLTKSFGLTTKPKRFQSNANALSQMEPDINDFLLYKLGYYSEEFNIEQIIRSTVLGVDILPSSINLSDIETLLVKDTLKGNYYVRDYIIEPLKDKYDFIFIDCPPSLSMLTLNSLNASDEVIIPSNISKFSIEGIQLLFSTIGTVQQYTNPKLKINGMLFTDADLRTNVAKQIFEAAKKQYKDLYIYDEIIPHTTKAEEALLTKTPLTRYAKTNKGAIAYNSFIDSFLRRENLER